MNAAYIESMMRKVLITGAAGFIGSCLSEHLFRQGYDVVGCDIYNFRNQFFDVGDSHHLRLQKLRYDRIAHFLKKNQIEYHSIDLSDHDAVLRLFKQVQPEVVVHLAAQAGVRHSVKAPMDFVKSNLNGFANVLEACKQFKVEEFLYASSSSVYGARTDAPFNETDRCETPESFYAATKKANELMAHAYFSQYKTPSLGLRFLQSTDLGEGSTWHPSCLLKKYANNKLCICLRKANSKGTSPTLVIRYLPSQDLLNCK